MSNAVSNAADQASAGWRDAAAEAAYLRSVIEKQASCLMRIAADGTLLALSDAALNLLGAEELAQVLDRNFVEHLKVEPADVWAEFAARVSNSGSASTECELTDLTGARRSVMLLGVVLPDHPDGIQSLLVTVRDMSSARRLESSLQEQEGLRQSIDELRTKLGSALAERQGLAAADQWQVQAALDQAIAEGQQLRSDLDAATGERQHLQALLADANASRQKLHTALAAATTQMQHLEMAAADRERLRVALDEAIAQREEIARSLDQMMAERDEVEAAAREREAKRQRAFAEHAISRMKAEQALAEVRVQVEHLTTALTGAIEATQLTRQILGKDVKK